jgi:hypothetical protein
MNQRNNCVFLHVATNTFFNTLFEYAKELKNRNLFPLMYFDTPYATLEIDLKKLRNENIQYELDLPANFDARDSSINQVYFISLKIIRRIDYYLFSGFFFEYLRLKLKYNKLKSLLIACQSQIVLMISDLVQYDTGLIIKTAHERKIKVILLPLFAANYKEAVEHNYNNNSLQLSHWNFQLFSKITWLKKWIINFKGKFMIRLPFHKIVVKEVFGVAPQNPWAINTGGADLMIVEGNAVKRLFLHAHSYDSSRIKALGSINLDKLHDTMQNRNYLLEQMNREFKLDPRKKNVLVAVPADMHASRGANSDFSHYNDLIEFWLSSIKNLSNYNIILSVHPSVPQNERDYFIKKGFNLLDKPTVTYIALFDLYIASISATIQWAIACGIPVINYDDYKYDYDDYLGVEGVKYVTTKLDFLQVIKQFNDIETLEYYTAMQKTVSHEWGIVDGEGVTRIIKLIDNEIIKHATTEP